MNCLWVSWRQYRIGWVVSGDVRSVYSGLCIQQWKCSILCLYRHLSNPEGFQANSSCTGVMLLTKEKTQCLLTGSSPVAASGCMQSLHESDAVELQVSFCCRVQRSYQHLYSGLVWRGPGTGLKHDLTFLELMVWHLLAFRGCWSFRTRWQRILTKHQKVCLAEVLSLTFTWLEQLVTTLNIRVSTGFEITLMWYQRYMRLNTCWDLSKLRLASIG